MPAHHGRQRLEVRHVGPAVVAELVLDLDHQDGPAVLEEVRPQPREQGPVPAVDGREEELGPLGRPQRHGPAAGDGARVREPGRQPAKVPLGADVGRRAQDDEEVLLDGEVEEAGEVAVAGEVDLVRRARLVEVPLCVRVRVFFSREVGLRWVEG